MATRSSKKGTKAASSASKKDAGKLEKAAQAGGEAMLSRVELIVAPPPLPQTAGIQIQPIPGPDAEDAIKCRTRTTLSLIPGIFKDIRTDNDPVDGRIRFTFVLNDSHAVYFFVPNCNPDGLFYLPELSSNIAFIEGPTYLDTANKRIRVKLFPPNPLKVIPFTFAFRIKFEENFNLTQQFNPKKANNKITVL